LYILLRRSDFPDGCVYLQTMLATAYHADLYNGIAEPSESDPLTRARKILVEA
jgi:hypothetical protein